MTHFERYRAALHAMQTGVAFEMQFDPTSTEPKHLRVGVNASMSDNAALVRLLSSKGIITEEEYYKEIADTMELEVKRYETILSQHYGKLITLV